MLKWAGGETFHGHGSMWITIQDGLALAYLGSNSKPGMILNGKSLDSLNMELVGGALLFEVLPTAGFINIKYSKSEGTFNITGDVATELPFVREGKKFGPYIVINAGQGSSDGIVYDTENNKLTVVNATFSIKGLEKGESKESVEIGGFQLKELEITIENNLPAGIGGKEVVPPGLEIGADLELTINTNDDQHPFQIQEISLSYLAENMEAVIPMGSFGFSMVSIGGAVIGMEDPNNTYFEGCLGFIYGDLIPLNFVVKKTNGALA